MDKVLKDFLQRNLPDFVDDIKFIKDDNSKKDYYIVKAYDNKVFVTANSFVSFCTGLYSYLKKYCNVQLSWCGNRKINIKSLTMFEGEYKNTIKQKYRVYLNYCTFDYSMCWWDFERWEREIDFMAMNGINMPLCIIGTEAVLYKTLIDFGFTKSEALSAISGPAFWAWHLMTNIDSYLPPISEDYINERLNLGRKILNRYIEFGMQPIQQGFSGHVPSLLKEKYPNSNIILKKGWCKFPKTAQIDPLDSLFTEIGLAYLKNTENLLGNYHYFACDPFHEGIPPKKSKIYLSNVGKVIEKMYNTFDENYTWVMQGWTPYEHIIKQVPIGKLLILDLNSECYKRFDKFYGHQVVAGMLHNFGGKNAMQGHLKKHSENPYLMLKSEGVNVVGLGMFMEGIEQNPVVYDLQFEMLTKDCKIDFDKWLDNYILRRYGSYNKKIKAAWDILTETCYSSEGYNENNVGSTVAARPEPMPKMTGPCCYTDIWYDTKALQKAVLLFNEPSKEFKQSDGYQYDLCDLLRQVMSNLFHDNQLAFENAYNKGDYNKSEKIAQKQLELLLDLDELLSLRSEMSFYNYISDCHNLAVNEEERKYFDLNARTLITQWGDIRDNCAYLYDYAWREWAGLIKDYYYIRWSIFYNEVLKNLKKGKKPTIKNCDTYSDRKNYKSFGLGRKINRFELKFISDYKDYKPNKDKDVTEFAKYLINKWL